MSAMFTAGGKSEALRRLIEAITAEEQKKIDVGKEEEAIARALEQQQWERTHAEATLQSQEEQAQAQRELQLMIRNIIEGGLGGRQEKLFGFRKGEGELERTHETGERLGGQEFTAEQQRLREEFLSGEAGLERESLMGRARLPWTEGLTPYQERGFEEDRWKWETSSANAKLAAGVQRELGRLRAGRGDGEAGGYGPDVGRAIDDARNFFDMLYSPTPDKFGFLRPPLAEQLDDDQLNLLLSILAGTLRAIPAELGGTAGKKTEATPEPKTGEGAVGPLSGKGRGGTRKTAGEALFGR